MKRVRGARSNNSQRANNHRINILGFMRKEDELKRQRRYAYWQIMLVAMCLIAARIFSITSVEGDTAFQSANDRSRWCTIASLVEDGTYSIDRVRSIVIRRKGKRPHLAWDSLDKVRHRGSDGKMHYYSSKPPLFPTLVSGVYWVVRLVSGANMTEYPIYSPRPCFDVRESATCICVFLVHDLVDGLADVGRMVQKIFGHGNLLWHDANTFCDVS